MHWLSLTETTSNTIERYSEYNRDDKRYKRSLSNGFKISNGLFGLKNIELGCPRKSFWP